MMATGSLASFVSVKERSLHFGSISSISNSERLSTNMVRLELQKPIAQLRRESSIFYINDPVKLEIRNVGLTVKKRGCCFRKTKEITLLDNVSASVAGGEVMAIMGPSGAGKTSMLNCATLNLPKEMNMTGTVKINDLELNSKRFRDNCYIVYQKDFLAPRLTCRETLMFAAKNCIIEDELIERHVDELIECLGLDTCQDTMVGDDFRPGLSGGQKRRLSVSLGLVKMPKILFLDEPTSGLDAVSALRTCSHLKLLTVKYNIAAMLTIHQPNTKIYNTFDKLMLLKSGKVAYFGRSADAERYFAGLGKTLPPRTNVADFLLDVVESKDFKNKFEGDVTPEELGPLRSSIWEQYKSFDSSRESGKKHKQVEGYYHQRTSTRQTTLMTTVSEQESWDGRLTDHQSDRKELPDINEKETHNIGDSTDEDGLSSREKPSLWRETWSTVHREALIIVREPMLYTGRCAVFVMMGIFFGLVYFESRVRTQKQVVTRMWLMLWLIGVPCCMACVVIFGHVQDTINMTRNVRNGLMRPSAYLIARLLQLPMMFLFSVCSVTLSGYLMCNWDWSNYPILIIIHAGTMYSFELTAELLALFSPHFAVGMLCFMCVWFIAFLFSGLLVRDDDVMWPLRAIVYIFPMRYGLQSMVYHEFMGTNYEDAFKCVYGEDPYCHPRNFYCPPEKKVCFGSSGEQVLESLTYLFPLISANDTTMFTIFSICAFCVGLKLLYIFRIFYVVRHK